MKHILSVSLSFLLYISAFAQDEAATKIKGFNTNSVFVGTSVNLGLSNNYFNIGLNPEIGYSINKWLDAGFAANLNYYTQNSITYKDNNFNYGVGSFLRIWPISFLHLQIQPEYNWISSTRKFSNSNTTQNYNRNAGSLLAGIGYGSRQIGSRFSHFTIMVDLLQELNSPYRDQFGDQLPVLRAGFGIYLKPKN